jgi:hypothetical protein
VLGLDAIGQRLGLLLHELLERGDPLADVLSQICALLQESLIEAVEPSLIVAHLAAEQDVADLVDVAAAQFFRGLAVPVSSGLRDGSRFAGLGTHVHPRWAMAGTVPAVVLGSIQLDSRAPPGQTRRVGAHAPPGRAP